VIGRYDNSNGAPGDGKLHEISIITDLNNRTIALSNGERVLDEVASHPVYSNDGLAIIYVGAAGLKYATRTAKLFDVSQELPRKGGILTDARPHSLSRDNCRLYFTTPNGAFVASRTPNLF